MLTVGDFDFDDISFTLIALYDNKFCYVKLL